MPRRPDYPIIRPGRAGLTEPSRLDEGVAAVNGAPGAPMEVRERSLRWATRTGPVSISMDSTHSATAPTARRLAVLEAGCAALLFACFAPTFRELVAEWILRPEFSHGFLMVAVAGWMVWERRAEFARLERCASIPGALVVAVCLGFLLLGEMKLSWFLKPYAFVGCAGGLVWAFHGWKGVRAFFPVLVVLFLMCPLPGRVERDLTLPLKRSAAILATGLLDVSGIHATLEGNIIHLPGIDQLWVADACSGIRSLISLSSLAILAALFWKRHWLLRLVVVLSCVPIAILVNSLRIWLTGFLSVKVSPDAAQGFFHFFEGLVLFGAAALLLWGWTALLARVFERRTA